MLGKMKNFRLLIWSLFIPSVLSFCGCDTPAKFKEVSSDAAYHSYVGAVYVLEVPMHLSGVNAPPGYEKTVDYYVLNPASPSWSGPELITRDTLPQGTLIEVESVHRCINCIFDFGDRLEAKIRIPNIRMQFDRPIKIPLEFLDPRFARKEAKNPNQMPQPTSGSVTPPADAGAAPLPSVADP